MTATGVRAAFPLIELLVVIAIIAILAAILFPVFAQARQAARTTQTLSNLRQVSTAVIMYVDDNDHRTPGAYYGPWFSQGWDFVTWSIAIYRYARNGEVMNDATQLPPVYFSTPGSKDPNGKDRFNWFGYGTLSANERGLFGWWEWLNGNWYYHWGRNLSSQERLAERSMLIASRDRIAPRQGMYLYANSYACRPDTRPDADPHDYDTYWRNTVWAAQRYHRERVCVAFGDTHAKAIPGSGNIYLPPTADYMAYRNWDADHKAFWGTDMSPAR